MNNALENLITRRSCRKYENKQISDNQLEDILLAGTYAPTGKNFQSPVIVVLQKEEDVAYLEKLNARAIGDENIHTFYGAPTVIVVFGNPQYDFYVADGNLVIGNILNAANAVGVDSCYIWRAKEVFDSEEGKLLMKKWGVPDNFVGIGNVILGYGEKSGKRNASPRKAGYIIKV